MYDNVGGKIKDLAATIALIEIATSVIIGMILFASEYAVWGIVVIVTGLFLGWISSILLYGFGQLVENSDVMVELTKRNLSNLTNNDEKCNTNASDDHNDTTRCPHCDRKISIPSNTVFAACPWCKKDIKL